MSFDVEAMQESLRRLQAFADDPHPGLATWQDALGRELCKLIESTGRKLPTPGESEDTRRLEWLLMWLRRLGNRRASVRVGPDSFLYLEGEFPGWREKRSFRLGCAWQGVEPRADIDVQREHEYEGVATLVDGNPFPCRACGGDARKRNCPADEKACPRFKPA